MAGSPLISLCMIVRDEEERLGRCLESARPFVDEIVVVDTGSTDGTVALAERHGARVVHEPWTDDFSAARNRSLEEARGRWILVLDADEILSEEAGRHLRRIAAEEKVLAAVFTMRCAESDGGDTRSLMVRAFRRREDIRFRYRIHEQVLPDIVRVLKDEGLEQRLCPGEIFHDGYLEEVVESRGKNERNLRIYELQLQETPDDAFMLYKYADFLRRIEGREEARRDALERAFAVVEALDSEERLSLSFCGQICALLAEALQREGDLERAFEVSTLGVSTCQTTADLYYVHGNTALLLGDSTTAEEAFEECRACADRPGPIACAPEIMGLGAAMGLARARFLQGWTDEAVQDAVAILEEHPRSEEALNLVVDLHRSAGLYSDLMGRLGEVVLRDPSWAAVWFRGAELLAGLRLYQKALPWIMRASELGLPTTETKALEGECFLGIGMAEKAMDAFEEGLPDPRCHAGLIVLQLLCRSEPTEPLDPSDSDLFQACRTLLGRITSDENHPFREGLTSARSWIRALNSRNRPFLEEAMA